MDDDLEPFIGFYNWDEAFAQNPDEPLFYVSDEERWRWHGAPRPVMPLPRKSLDTGSFSAV